MTRPADHEERRASRFLNLMGLYPDTPDPRKPGAAMRAAKGIMWTIYVLGLILAGVVIVLAALIATVSPS